MIRPIYFVMGKQCSVTEDWETVMAAMAADATYHQITFGDYQPILPDERPWRLMLRPSQTAPAVGGGWFGTRSEAEQFCELLAECIELDAATSGARPHDEAENLIHVPARHGSPVEL